MFMKEIDLPLSDHLYFRVVTPHHSEIMIFSQPTIYHSDMDWEMSNIQTDEDDQSLHYDLPACHIGTPSHLTTAYQGHLNISPSNDNERDMCEATAGREFAGDCCKDELAANKIIHTSIVQHTYTSESVIR